MLDFNEILEASCTHTIRISTNKKRALQYAAETLAMRFPDLDARLLFDKLMDREHLGSTGLGDGVAIPHCRMTDFEQIAGVFLKFTSPLEFEAPDNLPIDLMFVLVVPDSEEVAHLRVLSTLAAVFGSSDRRASLRDTPNNMSLHREILQLIDTVQAELSN